MTAYKSLREEITSYSNEISVQLRDERANNDKLKNITHELDQGNDLLKRGNDIMGDKIKYLFLNL
jgi:hypothetical protein